MRTLFCYYIIPLDKKYSTAPHNPTLLQTHFCTRSYIAGKKIKLFIIVSSITEKGLTLCSLKTHILPFFFYFLQLHFFSF